MCDRIAIITRGELRVSGTQEQLKRQFGTGFTVQLTVTDPNYDVENFLTENIDKNAAVKTRTGRVCDCHVPGEVELARLFMALFEADTAGHLQDWLVSETTLEDLFIRVVGQHEEQVKQVSRSASPLRTCQIDEPPSSPKKKPPKKVVNPKSFKARLGSCAVRIIRILLMSYFEVLYIGEMFWGVRYDELELSLWSSGVFSPLLL